MAAGQNFDRKHHSGGTCVSRSCTAPTYTYTPDTTGRVSRAPAATTIDSCSPLESTCILPGPLMKAMEAIASSGGTHQYAKLRMRELLSLVLGWSFTSEQSPFEAILPLGAS